MALRQLGISDDGEFSKNRTAEDIGCPVFIGLQD